MVSVGPKAIVCVLLLLVTMGCSARSNWFSHRVDHAMARTSFVSWNLRSAVGKPYEAQCCRAFAIASLSNRELNAIMQSKPAPEIHELAGAWKGINKGFGPALAGLTQDVKVFHDDGQCVHGHNRIVYQVPICDLSCNGWRSKHDRHTGKPKTIGKFVTLTSGSSESSVELDYTIAKNPWYDPSRFLVDELVEIEPNLMLGRANAKVGNMKIPVAYFVLFR